ncbi:N-acetyltransferase [Rhizobium sp.]|uniref:N-acetyltransferase n=1 Tax=Rhizobium sp. TaxID=391 RepID=UPI0028A5A85C
MNTQFPDRLLATKEDAIEAKAFVDLHRLSSLPLREKEHFDCLAIDEGCAISLPDASAIGLNRILGLASLRQLDQAFDWMEHKAGNRFLQLNVDAAPDDVKNWVRAKDLQEHGPGWAKLGYCPASRCVAPPVRVHTRVVAVNEATLFGAMMCEGFNFPPSLISLWSAIVGKKGWSCFFALDAETPIGTGAMFVSGEYAWLGGGTTRPEFRNRGVQKALIQARTECGVAQGVSTFVVETEVPSIGKPGISHENLRKMGFEQLYNRQNFRL